MGSKDISRARISELDGNLALDPEEARRALRYIAGNIATDADDLRELMDMLGLNERPMQSTIKLRSYRAKQRRQHDDAG